MKVTGEIRTHAQVHYGPRADDYLAAIDGLRADVEGAEPVTVEAHECGDFVRLVGHERARREAWILIARTDVVEFGWLT